MQPKHAKEQQLDTVASPSRLLNLTRYALLVYLALVLAAIVIVAPRIQYRTQVQASGNGPVYILSVLLLGTVATLAAEKIPVNPKAETPRAFNFAVAGAVIVLALLHTAIIAGGWFKSGWDVQFVTGETVNPGYFSMYPNNLFLLGLFAHLQVFAIHLGVIDKYLPLVIGSGVCLTVSMVLVTYAARKAAGYRAGYCTLVLSFICIGLTPWMLIPYSDTYAMPFTTAILWAYLCIADSKWRWGFIVFLTAIGYQIKPTVIFACAALVFVALFSRKRAGFPCLSTIKTMRTGLLRRWLSVVAACIFSLGLAFGTSQFLKNGNPSADPEASFGVAHFLMLGANTATDGVYSHDDANFSMRYDSRAARNAADLRVWRERLAEMGPYRLMKHLVKKSLINYDDGTFAWGQEGNFFMDTYGRSELIKSIYGIDDVRGGQVLVTRSVRYAPAAHALWLLVLIGCVLSLLGSPTKTDFVVCASLLMLSMFLLVFECRARYLLLYLPYYVLLGVIGWSRFARVVGNWRLRHERRNQ